MNSQNQRKNDEAFMRLALAEASLGVGSTSPNPAVGAVIVHAGQVVGRGYHRGAGKPHAEIEALRSLSDSAAAKNAILYVTLEPCSTHGRTPPCTEAIIRAGFSMVVIGALDPNPRHCGRALHLLRKAGIKVRSGVLSAKCRELNRAFNKWIVTGIPWVIAKVALTLDGRLTLPPGAGRWLSNAASRRHANRLRARVDAILIGAETLRIDNPRLSVRAQGVTRQPCRVVLTRSNKLPLSSHLFTDAERKQTIVLGAGTIEDALSELGRRDVTSVLIEGGANILGQAFAERVVDEVQLYLTPHLGGGGVIFKTDAHLSQLQKLVHDRIGDDVFFSARLESKPGMSYDTML